MEEIWKDIPGYAGYYQASNLGKIRSVDRVIIRNGKNTNLKGRIISPLVGTCGYNHYLLKNADGRRYMTGGRIVYITFVGDIEDRSVIRHIDKNRANDCLDNLRLEIR